MLMAFSLCSEGQASTTGLTSTSKSPPPMAYTITENKIPPNPSSSGSTVRSSSPTPERRWASTMEARYPILSTNPTESKSTASWMPK